MDDAQRREGRLEERPRPLSGRLRPDGLLAGGGRGMPQRHPPRRLWPGWELRWLLLLLLLQGLACCCLLLLAWRCQQRMLLLLRLLCVQRVLRP